MKVKRILVFCLSLILTIGSIGCTKTEQTQNIKEKPVVAVSIVPEETFVKAVAGNLVEVITMIPPGNNETNYQPTPREMERFSESSLYFSIGVPTEKANILPRVENLNKNIKVISLDDEVGKVYKDRYFEEEVHGEDNAHKHGGRDPHIWLSPNRVKVMIKVIRDELCKLDPRNKSIYEKNAANYIDQLDQLDKEIKETLKVEQPSFIVYHPALGYFADDYGLKMVAIEESGKKATPKKIQEVIDFAKRENIKVIFYQAEFDSQQAKTIGEEIGGSTIKVEPLSANYIENLRNITHTFKDVLK